MSRLAATLACDVRLQKRNGFYYAVAVVLAGFAVLVTLVPLDWAPWLPPLLMGNLIVGTFFFMAGLVLLEKGEGTLEALVVTPLADDEYLASKIITLTALGVIEHFAITAFATRMDFSPLPLLLAIVFGSLLYCLFGFLAVSPYDSINEYLFPSVLYTTFLSVPYVYYFGLSDSWLFYLHPLQGTLLLFQAAFAPISTSQWIFSILSSLAWAGLGLYLARQWFHRFIVRSEGAR